MSNPPDEKAPLTWLYVGQYIRDHCIYSVLEPHPNFKDKTLLVEKSAYDASQAEVERLRAELANVDKLAQDRRDTIESLYTHNGQLMVERSQLRAELAECIKEHDELVSIEKPLVQLCRQIEPEMNKLVEERDSALAMAEALAAALEKIANHKVTSVDKVYLIQQCEGFQACASYGLQAWRAFKSGGEGET